MPSLDCHRLPSLIRCSSAPVDWCFSSKIMVFFEEKIEEKMFKDSSSVVAVVESLVDDRFLMSKLLHTTDANVERVLWRELARRTLHRSLQQHNTTLPYIVNLERVTRGQGRIVTTFWRLLNQLQMQFDKVQFEMPRYVCSFPAVHDNEFGVLRANDGTLHSMPLQALLQSRVLRPLFETLSPNDAVPVPISDGTTLALLRAVLLGESQALAQTHPDYLARVLMAADFLDLKMPFETVWCELERRVTSMPLDRVPTLLAPFHHLQSIESGHCTKFAPLLCELADTISQFLLVQPHL